MVNRGGSDLELDRITRWSLGSKYVPHGSFGNPSRYNTSMASHQSRQLETAKHIVSGH